MKQRVKNLLAVAGIIGIVFGLLGAIPGFLQENYVLAISSSFLLMTGIILMAISFGD